MKRVISLWLPTFATDRISHRASGKTQVNPSEKRTNNPLVTVVSVYGEQRIMAVNISARAVGVLPNQSLADARALHPSLIVHQADPVADLKALTTLSTACERYTPWVAVDPFGSALSNDDLSGARLWLDVTGCVHLFGSEKALLEDLLYLFKRNRYQAHAGLASTPGAAWALARYKTCPETNPWLILHTNEDIRTSLAALPIAGLRLDYNVIEGLERIGLRYIGDLYGIPRAPLANRFGSTLLRRLDQALGVLGEPLSPQQHPSAFLSRLAFAEPINRREDVETALVNLLTTLCVDLEQANQGARRLLLKLYRVDNSIGKAQIGTSRPGRDPAHLLKLFREELGKVDPGFGVEVMVLAAPETNPLTPLQMELDASPNAEQAENAVKLVDRLVVRLGPGNITRLQPLASHLPELASREVSLVSMPSREIRDWRGPVCRPPRPLQLLLQPLPIEVIAPVPDGPPVLFHWRRRQHRVTVAEGPERITPEWWRIEENMQETRPLTNDVRDYYRIEDEDGKRYWLYREGLYRPNKPPTWYIHGFFA